MALTFSKPFYGFFRLLLVAALSGCTGFLPGLPAGYDVASNLDKGVIVGSVGTNPLGKQWREWSQYGYYSTSNPKLSGHVTSAVNWSNPFFPQPECPDDGLPVECGNLFAIILPAGEYEFSAVIPARDTQAADPWPSGYATALKGYRFEVKPGQATYIGNMLSRLCVGSSYSYYGTATVGVARAAQGEVVDMYGRDMPLLREKFQQLKNITVNNETMAGKAWRWEWKQSDDESIAANWQSDCTPVRDAVSESSDAN